MQGIAPVGCTSSVETAHQLRLAKAAHEFEAQMMKELVRPVIGDEDNESGSGGALTEFAGEALGQSLSRAGGFGIADRIVSSISRIETGCVSGSATEPSKDSGRNR